MKKYIIKSLLLCVVLAFALTQAACSDLFDQEPQGQWTEKDNRSGSFETAAMELYGLLKGYNPTTGLPPLAIHNWRCEDIEKGSEPGDNGPHAAMYDNFDYSSSNGLLAPYWSGNYSIIHKCNNLIDTLRLYGEAGNELSVGDSINLGEAHFFRAYCYFNLVRAFGEIPLIDFKLNDAMDANVPKTTVAKIYELIDGDLRLASRVMPMAWETQFTGRATKGSVNALHARTYMMRNDWPNMYAKAMEVISSGMYNLDTPYDQIFRESGENSSESVFELQCMATSSRPADGKIGSQFCQVQGVRGAGDWNFGWGFNTPTENLANAFEPGDPRKDETLLYFYKSGEDPASIPANKPWGEKPMAGANVMNKYYNKKVYTDPNIRRQIGHLQGFWFNIRIIRYADVVLMAAEAANEMGRGAEARDLLEKVRARARGTNSAILPKRDTTDQGELRAYIKHERRVELGCEWDRFYDLVRWGDARTVLHAAGKTSYQDKHRYLPLPQTEVDKSNGVLIQNPDYN